MKKILGIILVFILTVTLIACDQRINHSVKVTFKDVNPTSNSVDLKLDVKDEAEEISGKIFVSIREDKEKKDKETKEYDLKKSDDEDEDKLIDVSFTSLEEGKKYSIYVRGTIKEKSVLLTKEPYTFTTESPKDININSVEDFYKINDKLNYNYYLKTDLDFADEDQEKIDNNVIKTFTGKFDGGGFTIKNYKTTKSNTSIGLFGQLSKEAVVENLVLDNITIDVDSSITGSRYAGILFGQAQSTSVKVNNVTIKNSKINLPNINGNSNYVKIGFLGGVSTSEITNVNIEGTNEINVSQKRLGTTRIGGLLGHRDKTETKLENIYLEGVINYTLQQFTETKDSEGNSSFKYDGLRGKGADVYVGGFVGEGVEGTFKNIVSKVNVNVKELAFVIESESQLDDKDNKKNINIHLYVGGLFGYLSSPILLENVAYTGDIKIDTPSIENQVKETVEDVEGIKELKYSYKLFVRVGAIAGILNTYNQNLNNVYRINGAMDIFVLDNTDLFTTLHSGTMFGIADKIEFNETTNRFGVVGTTNDTQSVRTHNNIKVSANLLDVISNDNFIYTKLNK